MFLVIWLFAELLVGLVFLKAYLRNQLCEGLSGLRKKIFDNHEDDYFNTYMALLSRACVFFGLLGWLCGSVLGAFDYPQAAWWLTGLVWAIAGLVLAALAIGVPFTCFYLVIWTWKGLKYLVPERLKKSR